MRIHDAFNLLYTSPEFLDALGGRRTLSYNFEYTYDNLTLIDLMAQWIYFATYDR